MADARVRPGKVHFHKNPLLEKELLAGDEMVEVLRVKARRGAILAKAIAPVETGDYQRGIIADAGLDERGEAKGRIIAKDWKSGFIEFGTIKTPARAILRRAAETLGLRYEDGRGHGS